MTSLTSTAEFAMSGDALTAHQALLLWLVHWPALRLLAIVAQKLCLCGA